MDTGGISPGTAGGVFAGIVAAFVAIGRGVAWFINWKGARDDSRSARLRAWESSLEKREHQYRELIEARLRITETSLKDSNARIELAEEKLEVFESKATVMASVLFETLAEVVRLDPTSVLLARARTQLMDAFPLDDHTPPVLAELVRRIDRLVEERRS